MRIQKNLENVPVIMMAGLFAAILLLNVIPAFAPPTWMAMSWIGFNQPDQNPFLLAVVAACAATSGRLILARCSTWLVRGHLMREADRQNIDVVKAWLEKRKVVTAGALLLYAFSHKPDSVLNSHRARQLCGRDTCLSAANPVRARRQRGFIRCPAVWPASGKTRFVHTSCLRRRSRCSISQGYVHRRGG